MMMGGIVVMMRMRERGVWWGVMIVGVDMEVRLERTWMRGDWWLDWAGGVGWGGGWGGGGVRGGWWWDGGGGGGCRCLGEKRQRRGNRRWRRMKRRRTMIF